MIINDYTIPSTEAGRATFLTQLTGNNSNTAEFIRVVIPSYDYTTFNASVDDNSNTSMPAFVQTADHVIDGWRPTGVSIAQYLVDVGLVNGAPVNVIGSIIDPIKHQWFIDNKSKIIYIGSFAVGRQVYHQDGASFPGGSGTPTPELDFSVGGYWGARSFEGVEYKIENALRGGFLPRRRPKSSKVLERRVNRGMKPGQRATLHVIGLDGRKWLSTTDFILESVNIIKPLSMERVSTFEGETIQFSCETNEVYNFFGKLLDAHGFDQARTWVYNWNNYLDGNVLSANKCRAVLCYEGKIIVGYLMGFNSSSNAQSRFVDTLTFSMYVSEFVPEITIADKGQEEKTYEDDFTNGQYYKDKEGGIDN